MVAGSPSLARFYPFEKPAQDQALSIGFHLKLITNNSSHFRASKRRSISGLGLE